MLVSATSFDIAPYADNDNKFHVQHAFSTPNINLPPADTTETNYICQQLPQLRHIKFQTSISGKVVSSSAPLVRVFTHSLEWIRGAQTVFPVFEQNSAAQLPASSVTPPETNLPPRSTCFSSLPMNHHLNQLPWIFWNTTGTFKKIATEPAQKMFSLLMTMKPFRYLKTLAAAMAKSMK